MPVEVTDIKNGAYEWQASDSGLENWSWHDDGGFMMESNQLHGHQKDSEKNPNGVSKIKVRCQRYLYTISVKDADKAEKLKQSLPPKIGHASASNEDFITNITKDLTITDIPKKNAKGKHTA
ncbi:60s ribosomal l38 protein [Rutstroemia sp. NJR-2017a WRK4]|nr:60s ribosomal l38 protein [Rutstroemia sp. NJR-2017a WRK4]